MPHAENTIDTPDQSGKSAACPAHRTDLTGRKFTSPRYACVWTVLSYHRGGNWVCQEPDHGTTCHFHESEILAGECTASGECARITLRQAIELLPTLASMIDSPAESGLSVCPESGAVEIQMQSAFMRAAARRGNAAENCAAMLCSMRGFKVTTSLLDLRAVCDSRHNAAVRAIFSRWMATGGFASK